MRDSTFTPILQSQRDQFSLEDDVSYLNCAYMSPLSKAVIQSGVEGMTKKATPYQIQVSDFFDPLEDLKQAFAKLIGSSDPQRVVLQPSASYGIATVCQNLPLKKKGNIVLVGGQFPSNVYAFHRLAEQNDLKVRTIDPPKDFDHRGQKWNESIVDAIDDGTICLSISHCHWADGTLFDLEKLRAVTNDHQALLIIDGTQSVGALGFDVNVFKPDALICAGYKFLMGPYSSALSYYGTAFDQGEPIEYNWFNRRNSDDFKSLVNIQKAYRPGSFRYNVGEAANFMAVPMLLTALNQIQSWGVDEIQHYCGSISTHFLQGVKDKGYSFEEHYRANHLFGIYLPPEKDIHQIQQQLEQHKIHVSYRGDAIRISPHVYNTDSDMERLLELL